MSAPICCAECGYTRLVLRLEIARDEDPGERPLDEPMLLCSECLRDFLVEATKEATEIVRTVRWLS